MGSLWLVILLAFPFSVSSSSIVDNDFETSLGAWVSDRSDHFTWLVQNYDEYWGIPPPKLGTSYAAIYQKDCEAYMDYSVLHAPYSVLNPGDAISFKYFVSSPSVDSKAFLDVYFQGEIIAKLEPIGDSEWHSVILPLNLALPMNTTFYFKAHTFSYDDKVAVDDVKLVSLGTENNNTLTTPSLKNTSLSIIDNDFETDLGAWHNVPQDYPAGWLIENYDPIFYISPPVKGTAYLRAFRYNCYANYAKLRLESAEVSVKPGDAFAFSSLIAGQAQTNLKVFFDSILGEEIIVDKGSQGNTNWHAFVIPLDLVSEVVGKFAFELESSDRYDDVAIDDIRLLSLGTEDNNRVVKLV